MKNKKKATKKAVFYRRNRGTISGTATGRGSNNNATVHELLASAAGKELALDLCFLHKLNQIKG